MSISGIESQESYSIQDFLDAFSDTSGTDSTAFTEEMASELIDEFDTDGDGALSETEMAALTEKLEGMRDMMAALQQAMSSSGGGSSDSSEESEETEETDAASAYLESLFGSDSTDEADTNGDGVVSAEELAEYLGEQFASLSDSSSSDESESSSTLKDQLMSYALSAYQQNADSSMSDTALDLVGSSDTSVNAIA